MVPEGTYLVLIRAVLTFEVSQVSLERVLKSAAGPTVSWLVTALTFSIDWAMAVACALASSVGASPVSSTWPPYTMALTRAVLPSFCAIWLSALKAMFWSSSWTPEVRRSVTTTAVVAAAPPMTSGAQADSVSAAAERAAASSRGRAAVLASGIIRCLLVEGRLCRRTGRAAR